MMFLKLKSFLHNKDQFIVTSLEVKFQYNKLLLKDASHSLENSRDHIRYPVTKSRKNLEQIEESFLRISTILLLL